MRAVVEIGTGKPAFKDMPFAVAGKTGTAHVADGNIKYNDMVCTRQLLLDIFLLSNLNIHALL